MKKHLLLSLLTITAHSSGYHRDIFDIMQENMNSMEQHFKEMRQFFAQSFKDHDIQKTERKEPYLSHDINFNDTGLIVKIKNVANKEIDAHFNDYTLTLQHPDFSGSFVFNPKFNTLKTTMHVEQKEATESENQKSHLFFSSSQVESIHLPNSIDFEKTNLDYDENSQELTISFAYKQKKTLPINITRSNSTQQ